MREQEVRQQVAEGNEQALIALFERNYVSVRNRLLPEDATDEEMVNALQDAVIEYWEQAPHAEDESYNAPDQWVTARAIVLWEEQKQMQEAPTADQISQRNYEEKLNQLAKYVRYLETPCKSLLHGWYFERWNVEQIGKVTGYRAQEVEERVMQCKYKLNQLIKRNFNLRNLLY